MVKAAKLKGKQTKINTNGWKEGVYYIKIKYKNEQISAKLAVNIKYTSTKENTVIHTGFK